LFFIHVQGCPLPVGQSLNIHSVYPTLTVTDKGKNSNLNQMKGDP
jgi:hypothetical protein